MRPPVPLRVTSSKDFETLLFTFYISETICLVRSRHSVSISSDSGKKKQLARGIFDLKEFPINSSKGKLAVRYLPSST